MYIAVAFFLLFCSNSIIFIFRFIEIKNVFHQSIPFCLDNEWELHFVYLYPFHVVRLVGCYHKHSLRYIHSLEHIEYVFVFVVFINTSIQIEIIPNGRGFIWSENCCFLYLFWKPFHPMFPLSFRTLCLNHKLTVRHVFVGNLQAKLILNHRS